MIGNQNNRLKSFEQLREERSKYGYTEKLLQALERGDFNYLNEIDISDRNNKEYMEPLLFAVKNNKGSYEVFKYYGEELQKREIELAREIIVNEPSVLENTAIASDSILAFKLVEFKPEIIRYISNGLKNDGEFIKQICENGSKEAVEYAARECNLSDILKEKPELATNLDFMREASKEDASLLKYADESLKNNYEFIRETSMENREVINYVVEHTEEFGKEALEGAKDSLQEHFINDVNKDVQEERGKIEERERLISEGKDNEEEKKAFEKRKKDLDSIENAMKKFDTYSIDEAGKRAKTYLRVIKDIPEEYKCRLQNYVKLYEASKQKDEKKRFSIVPKDIESVSQDAKLSEIQTETTAIREEVALDNEQIKENEEEIGE